jgi:arylsulfatase A-like enzyme
MVSLTDVTATILAFAGCAIPEWMDALPMPGLGLTGEGHHDQIVGALSSGWMLVDKDWKLAKYARGGAMLFNRRDDPQELHNLARDPHCLDVYQRLDAELTRAIMRSVTLSHGEKRVYTASLSSDLAFGQQGWQRPYPQRVEHFGVTGPM